MQTRARAAVLVAVAGLTLSACGPVHPGAAAVVDGQSISMKTLDRTARAYCTLTLETAKQQGVTTISSSDVRRQAVTGLVSTIVARKLAKAKGIEVDPSTYELTADQEQQIAKAFPSSDAKQIRTAIEDSQEASEIAIALAEQSTGQQRTDDNEAQLAEAGQAEIVKAFKANHVKFAPRFALSASGKDTGATGSLSASPVDLTAPSSEDLPDSQRCS